MMDNNTALVFGLPIMAAGLIALALCDGCGHGAAACAAIDIAKTVCDTTPVRYLDDDGEVRTEQIPTQDLKALAMDRRAKRLRNR